MSLSLSLSAVTQKSRISLFNQTFLAIYDIFWSVWTSLDKFRQVWTSLDKSGQVWMRLDKLFWMSLSNFGFILYYSSLNLIEPFHVVNVSVNVSLDDNHLMLQYQLLDPSYNINHIGIWSLSIIITKRKYKLMILIADVQAFDDCHWDSHWDSYSPYE